MFELYEMKENFFSKEKDLKILKFLKKNIKTYDLVIINDFGHGLLSKEIIRFLEKTQKIYTLMFKQIVEIFLIT